MTPSRLAYAAGAATVVLLAGCDRTAASSAAARDDVRPVASVRVVHGAGIDGGAVDGSGIRPTGATANGITP